MKKHLTIHLCILLTFFSHFLYGQALNDISAGIGTNGISFTITQHLSKKLTFGQQVTVQKLKVADYDGNIIKRNGIAMLSMEYLQAGAFVRWSPWGDKDMYGYHKRGIYLSGGFQFKFQHDWLVLSAYYEKRRVKDTVTKVVSYPKGAINMNLLTNRIQPFIGMGYQFNDNDSKISLQMEAGISFHGKPDGFISTTEEMVITSTDRIRLERIKEVPPVFAFFQLNIGYNYYGVHKAGL